MSIFAKRTREFARIGGAKGENAREALNDANQLRKFDRVHQATLEKRGVSACRHEVPMVMPSR